MAGWHGRLLSWVRRPQDLGSVDRCLMLSAMVFALSLVYVVMAGYYISRTDKLPYLDRDVLALMQWVVAGYSIVSGLMAAACLWIRRTTQESRVLPHLMIQIMMVQIASGLYAIGSFQSSLWCAFLCLTVFAYLLFEPRVAGFGIATFLIVTLGAATAAWQGLIPYRPLMASPPFIDGLPSGAWLFRIGGTSTLMSLLTGLISYVIITQWREREALLHELSVTDELTKVSNRRHFMHMLDTELQRARRYDRPLSLVLLDLDYFKKVNDTHGHPAGDAVLVSIGRTLKDAVRTQDTVGRYGGEEFALVLPETDAAGSRVVAERCRAAIEATPVDIGGVEHLDVTASVGVASTDAGASATVADLIRASDEALYRAKEAGRNRVEMST